MAGQAFWRRSAPGGGAVAGSTTAASTATYQVQKKRTSGNISLNSTTWAAVDAASLDITLTAAAGERIEIGLSAGWGAEAVWGYLDAAIVVSGTATRLSGNDGVMAWRGPTGATTSAGGSIWYTVQAADVVGGEVTIRLMGRTNTASNRTISASANGELVFWARNHG